MDGTGENPVLIHGYANVELCCWFMNFTCDTIWTLEFDCVIVGKLIELMPDVVVGNDMLVKASSFDQAKLLSKSVSELFWTMVGNPQDMGTSDA